MKKEKILCLLLSIILLVGVVPVSTSALGNNEVLRETYSIYELDLNCLDNFILLHFYETEAYKVFIDMELCRNSQIQSMYKRLKAALNGEETPEEVFPHFEEILYNEVLQKELNANQLVRFIKHTPNTLKALGVDYSKFENASDLEKDLEEISGVAYNNIDALADALKNVVGSVEIKTQEKIEGFTDISNVKWAEEAINFLNQKGIIGGKSEGVFAPDDEIKREELAKILVLAFGLEKKTVVNFSDVNNGAWYYEFVEKTVLSGLMRGYDDKFGIGESVKREDLAVICGRYLKNQGKLPKEAQSIPEFSDKDEISEYAMEFVIALSAMGIINGTDSGEFLPKASITRAQAAKIIYETLNR